MEPTESTDRSGAAENPAEPVEVEPTERRSPAASPGALLGERPAQGGEPSERTAPQEPGTAPQEPSETTAPQEPRTAPQEPGTAPQEPSERTAPQEPRTAPQEPGTAPQDPSERTAPQEPGTAPQELPAGGGDGVGGPHRGSSPREVETG